MEPQTYEFEESITVSMASREYEPDAPDLEIDVRITWTPSTGIYVEPLAYQFGGNPPVKMSSGITHGLMDLYVRACVDENYDEACLARILADDPAFEGAALYQAAEDAADRVWLNSRRL